MASVDINHNVHVEGLSDLGTKISESVSKIEEYFSKQADTLNKMQGSGKDEQSTREKFNKAFGAQTQQFNAQFEKNVGAMSKGFGAFTDDFARVLHKSNLEANELAQKRNQNSSGNRELRHTLSAVGFTLLYGINKMGGDLATLGTAFGKSAEVINTSVGQSRQFLSSTVNNQLAAQNQLQNSFVSTTASVIGETVGAALGNFMAPGIGAVPGALVGGAVANLAASAFNANTNEGLARQQALNTFSINQADQSYYQSLQSARFGNQVKAEGRLLPIPEIKTSFGHTIPGSTYRVSNLTDKLMQQNSPFLNNANDIITAIPGGYKGDLVNYVNNLGKSALINNIPEQQFAGYSNQVSAIAKIGNRDPIDVLNKLNSNYVKYGGDTVKILDTVRNILQTTNIRDVDSAIDYVSRNQLNPNLINTGMQFEQMYPYQKAILEKFAPMFGFKDIEHSVKYGFSAQERKALGDLSGKNSFPNSSNFRSFLMQAFLEKFVGVSGPGFYSMVNNKPLTANKVGPEDFAQIQQKASEGPPSVKYLGEIMKQALSDLTITNSNITITGNVTMSSAAIPRYQGQTQPTFHDISKNLGNLNVVKSYQGTGGDSFNATESGFKARVIHTES